MPFKPDFLWGASTSAYQVEGASAEDGKGPSVQDIKTLPPGTADFTVASDHYHRFREDIALMAEMGLKAYRFSIAWTRIYPQGNGPVNVRGLQHYSEVIDTCLAHGLTPIVTMYHFDLPAALDAAGGWNNRATIDAFVQYARTLFEQFGDRVKYWLTINEQNMMVLAAMRWARSETKKRPAARCTSRTTTCCWRRHRLWRFATALCRMRASVRRPTFAAFIRAPAHRRMFLLRRILKRCATGCILMQQCTGHIIPRPGTSCGAKESNRRSCRLTGKY